MEIVKIRLSEGYYHAEEPIEDNAYALSCFFTDDVGPSGDSYIRFINSNDCNELSSNYTCFAKVGSDILIGCQFDKDPYEDCIKMSQKNCVSMIEQWQELREQDCEEIVIIREGELYKLEGREFTGVRDMEPKTIKEPPFSKATMAIELARYILRMRAAQESGSSGFIKGFHFNPNHKMDHCLEDIVVDKVTGMVRALVRYEGRTKKNNTLFPSSWSSENVVEELQNAMRKPVKVVKAGDRLFFVGEGSRGIRLKIVLDEAGNMLMAFPVLEKF